MLSSSDVDGSDVEKADLANTGEAVEILFLSAGHLD